MFEKYLQFILSTVLFLRGWISEILLNPSEIFLLRHHEVEYLNCRNVWTSLHGFCFSWSEVDNQPIRGLFHTSYISYYLFSLPLNSFGSKHNVAAKLFSVTILKKSIRRAKHFRSLTICTFFLARQRWSFSKGIIKQMTTECYNTRRPTLTLLI